MATKFALAELTIPMSDGNEFTFWFDGNGKVTVGNGTFDNPVANSFSLVQVEDCPFATPICKSVCYVHRLEKAVREVHDKYRCNSKTIREILKNSSYQQTVERAFGRRMREHCPEGFRWHVSGDIFSFAYACFIGNAACEGNPVRQWIYTRSFSYLEPILGIENLVVNLSADKDNWEEALEFHHKYGVRLCYLTVAGEIPKNLPDGSVIFPSYELRGRDMSRPKEAPWWKKLSSRQKRMVCPPDFFGQSDALRCGPCAKCLV